MPRAEHFGVAASQDLLCLPRPEASASAHSYCRLRAAALRDGCLVDGPLALGDYGYVLADTGTAERPYQVQELESGHIWWYQEQLLESVPEEDVPEHLRNPGTADVGDYVTLVPSYRQYSDAGRGPLSLSRTDSAFGLVVLASGGRLLVRACHPTGERAKWWYDKEAVRKVALTYIPEHLRAALRPGWGDYIMLTSGAWSCADVAAGPLEENNLGVVVGVDHKPDAEGGLKAHRYVVRACHNGLLHRYLEGSVHLVGPTLLHDVKVPPKSVEERMAKLGCGITLMEVCEGEDGYLRPVPQVVVRRVVPGCSQLVEVECQEVVPGRRYWVAATLHCKDIDLMLATLKPSSFNLYAPCGLIREHRPLTPIHATAFTAATTARHQQQHTPPAATSASLQQHTLHLCPERLTLSACRAATRHVVWGDSVSAAQREATAAKSRRGVAGGAGVLAAAAVGEGPWYLPYEDVLMGVWEWDSSEAPLVVKPGGVTTTRFIWDVGFADLPSRAHASTQLSLITTHDINALTAALQEAAARSSSSGQQQLPLVTFGNPARPAAHDGSDGSFARPTQTPDQDSNRRRGDDSSSSGGGGSSDDGGSSDGGGSDGEGEESAAEDEQSHDEESVTDNDGEGVTADESHGGGAAAHERQQQQQQQGGAAPGDAAQDCVTTAAAAADAAGVGAHGADDNPLQPTRSSTSIRSDAGDNCNPAQQQQQQQGGGQQSCTASSSTLHPNSSSSSSKDQPAAPPVLSSTISCSDGTNTHTAGAAAAAAAAAVAVAAMPTTPSAQAAEPSPDARARRHSSGGSSAAGSGGSSPVSGTRHSPRSLTPGRRDCSSSRQRGLSGVAFTSFGTAATAAAATAAAAAAASAPVSACAAVAGSPEGSQAARCPAAQEDPAPVAGHITHPAGHTSHPAGHTLHPAGHTSGSPAAPAAAAAPTSPAEQQQAHSSSSSSMPPATQSIAAAPDRPASDAAAVQQQQQQQQQPGPVAAPPAGDRSTPTPTAPVAQQAAAAAVAELTRRSAPPVLPQLGPGSAHSSSRGSRSSSSRGSTRHAGGASSSTPAQPRTTGSSRSSSSSTRHTAAAGSGSTATRPSSRAGHGSGSSVVGSSGRRDAGHGSSGSSSGGASSLSGVRVPLGPGVSSIEDVMTQLDRQAESGQPVWQEGTEAAAAIAAKAYEAAVEWHQHWRRPGRM